MIDKLRGYRSYLISGLGIAVVLLKITGVIDMQTMQVILGALGFGSIATLRAAISNVEAKS